MDLSTLAQLIAATSNIILSVVFAVGYYVFLTQNRQMMEQNTQMLNEMRTSRIARGRPQILVEADYTRLPMVDIVVRNVGSGGARDIEFDFSAPLISSTGLTLSELAYFREGMNFLESGEEVRSLWDGFNDLAEVFRQRGLEGGVTVTTRYRDLAGAPYEDEWNINPLLYEEEPIGLGGYKGMSDLVEVAENLRSDVEKIASSVEALVKDQVDSSKDEKDAQGT